MNSFERSIELPVSAKECFLWHEHHLAFSRLNPPFAPVKIIKSSGNIKDGAEVEISLPIALGLRTKWRLRHHGYVFGKSFSDSQVSGPFKYWLHEHLFKDIHASNSQLVDQIRFELPISSSIGSSLIDDKLSALFRYRHFILKEDLARKFSKKGTVLITGASGLVGSSLAVLFSTMGVKVYELSRKQIGLKPNQLVIRDGKFFGPSGNQIDQIDWVVNLAGAPIFGKRWSKSYQEEILTSRTNLTNELIGAFKSLKAVPSCLVSASGINYYGVKTPDGSPRTESSESGEGFLAKVTKEWESCANQAKELGTRVVNLRFGIILSPLGGALKLMLTPFKLGLGGPIGSGEQKISWISLIDALYLILFCIENDTVSGPVNCVAPKSYSNKDFSKILASVLNRPCLLTVPSMVMNNLLGDVAPETILADLDVAPSSKCAEAGFRFSTPTLEEALSIQLGV